MLDKLLSVGTIDSSQFKGVAQLQQLREKVQGDLEMYVEVAHKMGFYSESRYKLDVDTTTALEELCAELAKEYKDIIFFSGQLVFERETWTTPILHNQTALAIQRKLLFSGYQSIVLPIRVS